MLLVAREAQEKCRGDTNHFTGLFSKVLFLDLKFVIARSISGAT